MPTASQRPLLALLLLLAGLHAASAALVRPLYQVSDEVNYLASAQRYALASSPAPDLTACISPPDGAPPANMAPGGKALFHATAGTALSTLCRAGAGAAAPVALRLLFGLSLVVITWCGWHVAALLSRGPLVPALTALVLATQPVLAKYAGAVAPDSLANASAAAAVLCMVRWIVLGPSLMRLAGLVTASVLAAALKDTGLALVPVHGLVVVGSLVALAWRQPRQRVWLAGLAVVALAALPALVGLTRTSYDVGPGVARALAAPATFAGQVAADTVSRLPVFLSSAYWSLGGFGGTSASLPPTAAAIALALWAAAIVGLVSAWRGATRLPTGVLVYLGLLGATCLIQAPTRQVLLGMTDQHQGRWLFPLAVPVALALGTGLARLGARGWPLVTLASLTLLVSATLAVIQFHVMSPAWALDVPHLYLHSTGGHDIGAARTGAQVQQAWAAAHPPRPAVLALLSCIFCGAWLLRRAPVPGPTHVHHADHR